MSGWVTTHTRYDGKRKQKKSNGNAWAIVLEGAYSDGRSAWHVFVGDGDNEVASGASRTLTGAKWAASRALKKAGQ